MMDGAAEVKSVESRVISHESVGATVEEDTPGKAGAAIPVRRQDRASTRTWGKGGGELLVDGFEAQSYP